MSLSSQSAALRGRKILVLVLAAGGCAKPAEKAPATAQKAPTPQVVNATDLTTTAYGPPPKTLKLWVIHAANGEVALNANKVKAGAATRVSGTIYREGVEASSFSADEAGADATLRVLTLVGNVVMTSKSPKATLTCDRVRYEPDHKVIKASGAVKIVGANGAVGTLPEAWASPDLSKFATPDLFYKQP